MSKDINNKLELYKEQMMECGYKESDYTAKEWKLIFLAEELCDITTYDSDLDLHFGERILNILKVINDGNTFTFIKDKNNYLEYITIINLMPINWLEWGSSIRGAWFSLDDIEFDYFIPTPLKELNNPAYGEQKFKITTDKLYNWLLEAK